MVELNKSAFHTEEFHCLDFLLLGARNELCNLYYTILFIAILLKYLYTVFIGILIIIVVFIHVIY